MDPDELADDWQREVRNRLNALQTHDVLLEQRVAFENRHSALEAEEEKARSERQAHRKHDKPQSSRCAANRARRSEA